MNIYFRVDASVQAGIGHLMRCAALAEFLRESGASVGFVSRKLPDNLYNWLGRRGFKVHCLPEADEAADDATQTCAILGSGSGADWLIVDHYGLDCRWEKRVRSSARRLMVIDDLADRRHDCDLLLDQNFFLGLETRYQGLLPPGCVQLLGPPYALLRPEFRTARQGLRKRDGSVKSLLVSFGGSDPTGQTSKALRAIAKLHAPDLSVDVVIGPANSRRAEIEKLAGSMPRTACRHQVRNMAELMARADLYLGAAGITTWERCCLGLPSLVVTVAPNQVESVRDLADRGLLYFVGESHRIGEEDIASALENCLRNPSLLRNYSRLSFEMVDGLGASRCVNQMFELTGGKGENQ